MSDLIEVQGAGEAWIASGRKCGEGITGPLFRTAALCRKGSPLDNISRIIVILLLKLILPLIRNQTFIPNIPRTLFITSRSAEALNRKPTPSLNYLELAHLSCNDLHKTTTQHIKPKQLRSGANKLEIDMAEKEATAPAATGGSLADRITMPAKESDTASEPSNTTETSNGP